MKTHHKHKFAVVVSLLALTNAFAAPFAMAGEERIADQKVKIIAGEKFTFTKYIDDEGNIRGEILNGRGQIISERDWYKSLERISRKTFSLFLASQK